MCSEFRLQGMVFSGGSVENNPSANGRDARDPGSIPGSGRSPGIRNGKPFQYSYLEKPMDRGAWWATVHGVAKSQTRLRLSPHWLSQGRESFSSAHLGLLTGSESYTDKDRPTGEKHTR